MSIKAVVIILVLLFHLLVIPAAADRGVGSIDLSANPNPIAADGKSVCTVSARVRDRDGNMVPDGTEIRFTASLGVIEETGVTSAGVARAKLVSADMPGECVVTATWVEGQAVARTSVEFGEEVAGPQGHRYISIDADEYLAYSMEHRVIEALGNVHIKYRTLELKAAAAQVDMDRGRIVARGEGRDNPVRLIRGDNEVEADLFTCDLASLSGVILSADLGGVRSVDISKCTVEPEGKALSYMPGDFDFTDISYSSMLVNASHATVFPQEKIQFKNVRIYVDGKRILSLPFYVYSLTGALPEEGGQYVGYSTGGLTLNLPVYFSLTPSSSGAVLVRHGPATGWGDYGQKPGWFVDLRERYATDNSEGTFVLSDVTGGNWGAHLSHSQSLGDRTSGYMYLDYPEHRDLYGSINLNHSFETFSAGINLQGAKYQDAGSLMNADLYLQTNAKRIGKSPYSYTLSSRTGYATGSGVLESGLSQSLQGRIYSRPISLSDNVKIRNSVGLGYLWSATGSSGLSALGSAVLDWRLGRYSSVQLGYRFSDRASIYARQTGKQSLSASCMLSDGKKWRASIYAIKGLDYPSDSLFADLSYRLDDDWRLGVRSTFNNYSTGSYNDLELSVGKMIGSRELIAVWSQSQNKIMFELGSGGF